MGQDVVAATTEEEYNYMTKGYRIQVESGLDMKKGYAFAPSELVPVGNYSFELKPLVRLEENQIAGILVIAKSGVSGRTYYLAIPIGNESLLSRYYADLREWDSSILSAYSLFMSVYLSDYLSRLHALQKG